MFTLITSKFRLSADIASITIAVAILVKVLV